MKNLCETNLFASLIIHIEKKIFHICIRTKIQNLTLKDECGPRIKEEQVHPDTNLSPEIDSLQTSDIFRCVDPAEVLGQQRLQAEATATQRLPSLWASNRQRLLYHTDVIIIKLLKTFVRFTFSILKSILSVKLCLQGPLRSMQIDVFGVFQIWALRYGF